MGSQPDSAAAERSRSAGSQGSDSAMACCSAAGKITSNPARTSLALSTRLVRAGFEVIFPAALQQAIAESEPWLPALLDLSAAAESGCDPIAQADVLNAAGSDFNIAVGLCMGCDSVLFRHAEAPTTVLCCAGSQALVTEMV